MNKLAWALVIVMTAGTATGFVLYSMEVKERKHLAISLDEARSQHKAALEAAEKQKADALAAAELRRTESLAAAAKQQADALAAAELRRSEQLEAAAKQQATLLENVKAENAKALELVRAQNKKDTDDLKAQQDASDRRNAAERELDRKRMTMERLSVEVKDSGVAFGKAASEFMQRPSSDTFAAYTGALADMESKFEKAIALATEAKDYIATNPDLEPSTRAKALKNKDDAEKALAQIGPARAAMTKARTGIRHAEFDVQANEEWQSFPLQVAEGETVCVEANGQWRWGKNIGGNVGAAGENGDASYRIVSNLGNGALVARVQGLAQMFAGAPSFTPSRGGTLQFQINDNQVRDNSGALRLSVWILPNPK